MSMELVEESVFINKIFENLMSKKENLICIMSE